MSQTDTAQQDTGIVTSVQEHLDRLVAFEPGVLPVISLYLNAEPDKHGRDQYDVFLRQELDGLIGTFPSGSAERESLQADVERIRQWIENDLQPSANGIAIFACHGAGLFETVQLNVPVDEHKLYVYNQPHLYHLAHLDDAYPRYAAVLTDTNSARITVFGLGQALETEEVSGKKVQRVKVGGWSQARYQRRAQNAYQSHAKEVIDALDRIVREENIKHIVIAGDPTITPLLQEEMPKHLQDKVVDFLRLDQKASETEVLEATLARMREEDEKSDAEKVERFMNEYRSRGLAIAGPKRVLTALANGQVDELLLCTNLEEKYADRMKIDAILAPEIPDSSGSTDSDEPRKVLLADLLVTRAKQTDARITFIENSDLMAEVGCVGAFLRWRS